MFVTSKVKNKIACCLSDSQEMLGTMYVNERYKERCKGARIRRKYDKIMTIVSYLVAIICTAYGASSEYSIIMISFRMFVKPISIFQLASLPQNDQRCL